MSASRFQIKILVSNKYLLFWYDLFVTLTNKWIPHLKNENMSRYMDHLVLMVQILVSLFTFKQKMKVLNFVGVNYSV